LREIESTRSNVSLDHTPDTQRTQRYIVLRRGSAGMLRIAEETYYA